MGAELYRTSPVFAVAIDRCAAALDGLLPHPLRTLLFDRGTPGRINETEITQPVLFALEYALARQWMAWGFTPDVVLGHSLGEWVAACIGGAYSVEDACTLVFHRAALMQRLCARGAMASVAGPVERADELLARQGAVVTAYNAPESFVIGGEGDAVTRVIEELEQMALRCTRLSVSHAFHSPLMDPMLAPFAEKVSAVRGADLSIPLISNLDGRERHTVDAEYWARQIRNPVRFASCLETLRARGMDLVIEIGPHPVLSRLAERAMSGGPAIVSSLRRDRGDLRSLHESLGQAWRAGIELPWAKLHDGSAPKRVHVPSYPYPYQRKAYELDAPAPGEDVRGPCPEPKRSSLHAGSDLAAVEAVVVGVWCETLGIDAITLDSDFTALGADSLDAVGLLARTKQATGVSFTLEEQYRLRTPGAIARLLHERLAELPPASAARVSSGSPAGDSVRAAEPAPANATPTGAVGAGAQAEPARVAVQASAPVARRALGHVLVAGATTFLGAHLVKELYDATASTIDCLVGSSEDELDASLRFYLGDAFAASCRHRVRFVRGDLRSDALGLTTSAQRALGRSLDELFDLTAADGVPCGAAGVRGALGFVGAYPRVRYHHVSSLGAQAGAASEHGEVTEPASPEALASSTLEAERLVGDAQREGRGVTLYRSGDLVGHAVTGRMARVIEGSPLYRELHAILASGVVADEGAAVDLTPVDYAASAVVELARRNDAQGRTFHVCNPTPLPAPQLHDALRAIGYPITAVPPSVFTSWRGPAAARGIPVANVPRASVLYACRRTQAEAEKAGVHCPSPDRDLLFRLIRHGIELDFFAPPPSWGLLNSVFAHETQAHDQVYRSPPFRI